MSNNNIMMQYLLIFSLLISFSFASKAEEAIAESKTSHPQQTIAEVNISYALFTALAEYAELTQTEKNQHIDVNLEIIPVLEVILQEYAQELQKYNSLLSEEPHQELQTKLNKLMQYARDFRQELIYRKKVVELNNLIKTQKTIKQGK